MRTYYVRALDMVTNEVTTYSFPVPQYGDVPNKIDGVGFYRTVTSMNGFFHASGPHYRNWTDKRLFSLKHQEEMKYEMERDESLKDSIIPLSSLFGFYRHIGYDYKAKKYTTGEKFRPHSKR